jgi:hypothetical protein
MRVMVTKGARRRGSMSGRVDREVLEVSEKCGYRGYLGYLYDIIEVKLRLPLLVTLLVTPVTLL